MGKRYDHFTSDDRKLIARLHDDKTAVTVIALQLALQLPILKISESMCNYDSNIVGRAGRVD